MTRTSTAGCRGAASPTWWLDDRDGGGALSLRYVTAELRSVLDPVEYASYGPQTGKQLLTS